MKILFAISVLSFLALIGAAVAITRHIRRNSRGIAPAQPFVPASASAIPAPIHPDHTRAHKNTSAQRHDQTYSNRNSGDLKDPEARISTRPSRDEKGRNQKRPDQKRKEKFERKQS